LVTQAAAQLTQLAETLHTLRQTYEETKRVAGYADDAIQSFSSEVSVRPTTSGD
jgi:hypothetical protein